MPLGSTSDNRNRKPLTNSGWSRSKLRYASGPSTLPLPFPIDVMDLGGLREQCAHPEGWVRRQPIVRGDAGIPTLSKIRFQGLVGKIGDPGMMSYKPGDRLGGPQVPQKGTFVLAPDLSMLDAELKVRGQEASGGREEEHAAQRNKGRQAMNSQTK